jgi:hypothetical protein
MNSDKAAAVRDSIKGCPGIVDADDLARLEHAELVELVNIAVDRLRSTADSLERWDDWPSAPRGLRSTADIIERRARKEVSE